jgi:hypothetical protein
VSLLCVTQPIGRTEWVLCKGTRWQVVCDESFGCACAREESAEQPCHAYIVCRVPNSGLTGMTTFISDLSCRSVEGVKDGVRTEVEGWKGAGTSPSELVDIIENGMFSSGGCGVCSTRCGVCKTCRDVFLSSGALFSVHRSVASVCSGLLSAHREHGDTCWVLPPPSQ